jgi:hypothetical protein
VTALARGMDDHAQEVAILRADVGMLKGDVATLKSDVAVIRAELALMKWMHGITIGGVLALIIKAFFES